MAHRFQVPPLSRKPESFPGVRVQSDEPGYTVGGPAPLWRRDTFQSIAVDPRGPFA